MATQSVRADSLEKVSQYLYLGQVENAKQLLNDFLSTNPDADSMLRAKGLLGNAYLQEGKYLEAISQYEEVFNNSKGEIKIVAANNLTTASMQLVEKYDRDLILGTEEGDLKTISELSESISRQKSQTTTYQQQSLKLSSGRIDGLRFRALLNADKVDEATTLVTTPTVNR